MPNGDKPGEASAEKWAERFAKLRNDEEFALTKLEVRAERRSADFEEDSAVILREALERQRLKGSDPPSGPKPLILAILMAPLKAKGWPQVVALAVVVAGLVAVAYLRWGR